MTNYEKEYLNKPYVAAGIELDINKIDELMYKFIAYKRDQPGYTKISGTWCKYVAASMELKSAAKYYSKPKELVGPKQEFKKGLDDMMDIINKDSV